VALTGTAEQVAQAAKGYRVYYAKHPEAGGDSVVGMSRSVWLCRCDEPLHGGSIKNVMLD
jgi:hypothetical protein